MTPYSPYKHCVSMGVIKREIIENHDDYVVVVEYLAPDPNGPFLVMSDHAEPELASVRMREPKARASDKQ